MRAYLIRRLLLIPLTLVGVTFVVFVLTRILPGGPLEKRMQASMAQEGKSGGKSQVSAGATLNESQMLGLKRTLLLDKPLLTAFAMWWGIWPTEVMHRDVSGLVIPEAGKPASEKEVFLPMVAADGTMSSKKAKILCQSASQLSLALADGSSSAGWEVRKEKNDNDAVGELSAVAYQRKFSGVLQWNFRTSLLFGDPVWDLIKERFPISIFYGLLSIILTYGICIPLGIVKAIRHRTWVDRLSSVGIFVGYAIPGFALGTLLLLGFAFHFEWFPMAGFVSENFAKLTFLGKIKDVLWHAVLPLVCYGVSLFALTTMLMKNNLMDNLAADYVRTAVAKGSDFKGAVVGHALRNSLIPIGTTLGNNISMLVGGSMLIERVFDIPGFGTLTLRATMDRDYPISMAIIFLAALLTMVGNLLSDIIVAWLNPRIRFE
jgi:microcin C transport system permease protein